MSDPDPLLNEVVTFIQNDVPGFEAGTYRLQLAQTLIDSADGGGTINQDPIALSYDFAVSGDRFAFAQPDSAVFAVFPPDTASGAWDTVFPHAVFPLSNLPWIRSPTRTHPEPDAVGDLPTWLYVLLLDDEDAGAGNFSLDPATGVIGDLFPASVYPQSSLGAGVSYFSDGGDASALEPGQAMDSPIAYLDVPLSLFWQVAPTIADLALMAHVREVSFVQKPTIPSVTDVGQPIGTFSIVFGNRLPQDGVNTRCYLVSLEALADYLPTAQDGGAPQQGQDGSQLLRLAVLRSWRFRSTGQPASFVDSLLALNDGTQSDGKKRTVLQRAYAGANPALQAGFEMGYVPLNTVMRTGEDTLSWYRGPLAPYANAVVAPALPVPSPDAALIFDPTTGLIDMSYGAAWTIGRLVALQDQSFSVPLYGWKQRIHRGLLASVSGGILAQRLATLSTTALPPQVSARIGQGDLASFGNAQHLVLHALAGGN